MPQLKSWHNYIIFIAVTASLANLVVMAFSWWSVLLLFLWLARVLMSRQQRLKIGCFVVLISCASYFFCVKQVEQQSIEEVEFISTQVTLQVAPLDMKINGDRLTLRGIEVHTNKRYLLNYQLKTEVEKRDLAQLAELTDFIVESELQEAPPQRNLNGFNYQGYLIQEGIYHYGQITKLVSHQAVPLRSLTALRATLKAKLHHSFTQRLPSLGGNYLTQLMLGIKDPDLKEVNLELNLLGIGRLLTMSGLQIYYSLRVFRYICLRVGITIETFFYIEVTLIVISLYLFLGEGLGITRALLFLLVTNLNRQFEKQFSSLDCWSLTLLICLFLEPYLWLRADGQLTFLLSFVWHALSTKMPRSKYVQQHLLISLLATPLLAYHFYEWHLGSLFLSLLVLPLVVYGIWPTLLVTWLLTFFVPNIPWLTAIEKFLSGFNYILGIFARQVWLRIATGAIPLFLLIVCLGLVLYFIDHLQKTGKAHYYILLLIVVLPWSFKYVNPFGIVGFVDIGQGDAMIIQQPFHQGTYLIDVGGQLTFPKEEWAQVETKEQQLTSLLKSRGVKSIETVFITHGHVDHMGNLVEIGEKFKIKKIIYPSGMLNVPHVAKEVRQLQATGTDLIGILKDNEWQYGKLTIRSLAPFRPGLGENRDSIVLQLEFKNRTILQMGDLEAEGEAELLATNQNLQHDILGVGHHGSRSSSTRPFLESVRPKESIISLGRNNLYKHPHEETLTNLALVDTHIYRTDLNGMVYYHWYGWNHHLGEIQTIR